MWCHSAGIIAIVTKACDRITCTVCARSSWVLLPHVSTRCRLRRVPPTLMGGGGGGGGGSAATAAQTHSVESTLPEETRIQCPTNVLLSSSGNKTSRAGVLPLCGSASAGLYSPEYRRSAVGIQVYSESQNRRKMGPVSAISVLILGIVVPALAGYIEVGNATLCDLFRARLNPHQHEVQARIILAWCCALRAAITLCKPC